MATLNATLTLTSSDAFDGQNISVSATDALTIAAPYTDLSLERVDTTGANSIILPAATAVGYLYVKHTGKRSDGTTNSDAADYCDLEITDDNSAFARLAPTEFLFMPFNHNGASVGVQLQMTQNDATVEYAYFTKG